MNKVKIGLFGGKRGLLIMEPLYDVEGCEVVAVCDMDRDVLKNCQKSASQAGWTPALYTDFEEFFKHDMDAVILANYATEHTPYAIRFLKSGRHVYSEVPVCLNLAEAVKLIEAVEDSGKIYTVGENYAYMDDMFEMWRRYERGDIGELAYAEGSYMHDWSKDYPASTGGNPNHWRHRAFSTFYCTHSIGPILAITGLRPVQVVGFETNLGCSVARPDMGYRGGGAGIEMVTLENGAILRSVHGGMKREPWQNYLNYTMFGSKGTMESNDYFKHGMMVYREGDKICTGTTENYFPEKEIAKEAASRWDGHKGADFYPGYFFVRAIQGHEDGKRYAIDVYTAVDMSICGILAYRSILNGNIPIRVPDLRKKEERDLYRNDRACTIPELAGDQLIPARPGGETEVPEEVYLYVQNLKKNGILQAEKGYEGFDAK